MDFRKESFLELERRPLRVLEGDLEGSKREMYAVMSEVSGW